MQLPCFVQRCVHHAIFPPWIHKLAFPYKQRSFSLGLIFVFTVCASLHTPEGSLILGRRFWSLRCNLLGLQYENNTGASSSEWEGYKCENHLRKDRIRRFTFVVTSNDQSNPMSRYFSVWCVMIPRISRATHATGGGMVSCAILS